MYTTQIDLGSTYYLELFVTDSVGSPKTGLSVTYTMYRSTDDSLLDSGSLTEIGNGIYKKAITFSTIGQYRIVYTTPINYTDEIEVILVKAIAASEDTWKRILGLCQENYRILNPQYDKNNNMTSGVIKIYSTASDVDTDTSAIASYHIESLYNLRTNLMTSYKVKRLS